MRINRGNKEIPLAILSRILPQSCVTPLPEQWRMQDFRKGGSIGREAALLGGSGGMPPPPNLDILDALR